MSEEKEERSKRLAEILEETEALLADGFEEAFLGVFRRFGMTPIALYDYDKCIEVLVSRDGMSEEEAEEFFEYNVIGAWMGDGTPGFANLV